MSSGPQKKLRITEAVLVSRSSDSNLRASFEHSSNSISFIPAYFLIILYLRLFLNSRLLELYLLFCRPNPDRSLGWRGCTLRWFDIARRILLPLFPRPRLRVCASTRLDLLLCVPRAHHRISSCYWLQRKRCASEGQTNFDMLFLWWCCEALTIDLCSFFIALRVWDSLSSPYLILVNWC